MSRRLSNLRTLLTLAVVLGPATAQALAVGPLAALPEQGSYVSVVRVLVVFFMLLPWFAFCQWVDQDCQFLRKINRELWNAVVLAGGVVGIGLWLLLPWQSAGLFAAGFALWLMVTGSTCAVYVVVRNNMVDHSARVFTPRHIKAKLASLGKPKEEKLNVVERVRLTDSEDRKVKPPDDPNESDAYEAAQNLLFDAFWRRATELDLLIGASSIRLVYRIDGVLTPRDDLFERDDADDALRFIKKIAGLDVNEKRKPQQGEISGALSGVEGGMTDVEVSTSGTTKGERLQLKIVSAEGRLRVADLGLMKKQVEQFEPLVANEKGLILVCGPRGAGVTTTLYACLRSHDAFIQNLLTMEREPLMDLENVTQHVYDPSTHEGSYSRQLQTVLRREPDIVMVSDCQDRETAHLAVKAANAGEKIYMGIQARDVFDGLRKLVSLAGDMEGVADSLLAVTSQRLIRKLCIACRQAYRPDPQLLKKANLPVDKIEHFFRPPPEGAVDAKGNPIICTNCQGSGYYGRTGVFELLEISDEMRELIRKGQPINVIQAQARKQSMLYLQESALRKVIEGVTSMNEVLRALRDEESAPPSRTRKAE